MRYHGQCLGVEQVGKLLGVFTSFCTFILVPLFATRFLFPCVAFRGLHVSTQHVVNKLYGPKQAPMISDICIFKQPTSGSTPHPQTHPCVLEFLERF